MTELGTITDGHTVCLERVFPVSVAQLWAYLTTPDGLSRWLAEGQIGPDRVSLRFPGTGLVEGPVTAWDPPRLVEFGWEGGTTQPHGSLVRFELAAEGGGSRLVVKHTRITGEAAPDFAAGWHWHLDALGYISHGDTVDPDRLSWAGLYDRYRSRAAVQA